MIYRHDIEENSKSRGIRLGCTAYVLFGGVVMGLMGLIVVFFMPSAGQKMGMGKPILQIILLFGALVLWVWSPFQSKRLRVRIFSSWLLIVYYAYSDRVDIARFRLLKLNRIKKIERINFPEFFAHVFPYPDKPQLYLNRHLGRRGYDCVLVGSPHDVHNLKEGIGITIDNYLGPKIVFESDDINNCIEILKNATGLS